MAGVRLLIETTGVDTAQRQLNAAAQAGQDLTPLMRDVGEYLQRTTRERFDAERDPDGQPWAPLSETYRRRKKRNKHRILTLDGNLHGTITYQAGPTELLLGSPLVYAGTMHFGAPKGSFGATQSGQPIPFGDIPARPIFGLSTEDEAEITALVADYISDALTPG